MTTSAYTATVREFPPRSRTLPSPSHAGAARPWPRHLQRRRTPAQSRVVRHAQREAEQADNGADQALGLA